MTAPPRPPPGPVLVGVVHLDPATYRPLRALLAQRAPRVITVEVSEYAVTYRRENGARLLFRLDPYWRDDGTLPPALEAVAAQIAIPVELRAARDHAARHGVEVRTIGDSDRSQVLLTIFEQELMAPENLARLAEVDAPSVLTEQVRAQWQRARTQAIKAPVLGTDDAAALSRDEDQLAAHIRRAATEGDCLHIGGWAHLHELAARLADLQPTVQLLRPDPD